jgi:dehydrogenase/reductase SDR family member 4
MTGEAMTGPEMFSLRDKVAVVTGATRGIGRAIAQRMAEAGAKIVVSSRKADACDKVAAELRAGGHDAVAIPCNVSRKEDVERLAATAIETCGKVDILVCNAAANIALGPMGDLTDEAFDKMIATNVQGVWRLCNLLIPQMAERGDGAVIVTSSIAAVRGVDFAGLYGVTKAAEVGLVRNYAVEWGSKNVRVNAILPGFIKTDFSRAIWENDAFRNAELARIPMGRIGEPDDIAGIAVMLASRAGAFITGQTIVADGGMTVA